MRTISPWGFVPLAFVTMVAFGQESRADSEALLQASRTAAKEFGETLKGQLMAALQAGGPVLAIDVCKTVAGQIAADVSSMHGLSVRRTALRVRNERNAPDPFERQTLERFVEDLAHGKDVAILEHFEVVSGDKGKVFRYMKAIPTAAAPCLSCHGTNIGQDVRERLHERYPNDQAVGFKAGDLRGAFSLSATIP